MSLSGLFQSAPPDVAIEIEAGHVAAARLSGRAGAATIAAHAIENLPAGAVVPTLTAANIHDMAAVTRALGEVLSRVGRPRRAALVVPDTAAKVSLIRFEKVPARAHDLQELVKWQIRKSAPFPLEQGIVTVTPGARVEGGQEFIVAIARRDVIEQYQQACAQVGVHAGLVDLATFSIVNGVLASSTSPQGDWLLVHVTPAYMTLTVVRENNLIFFRNRADDAEGTLADVVHQTAMYYEDRLKGGGFTRVLLAGAAGAPGGAESLRRNLEERLGLSVEAVDPRSAADIVDRIMASPELLDALSPLVGILMRERKVA
jgi:Tfp pilus assembly PilM family ATPase